MALANMYIVVPVAAVLLLFAVSAAGSDVVGGGSGGRSNEATTPILEGQSDAPEVEEEQAMLQLRSRKGEVSAPEMQWAPNLPEKTKQCIVKSVTKPMMWTLQTYFEGRGKNPATICAVVPKAEALHGIAGRNSFGFPTDMADWWGKEIRNCTMERDGKCYARELINLYVEPDREMYAGNWSVISKGWGDGKPSAVLEYDLDALPNFHDELRPWCTCGVKVYLGMFFYFQRGVEEKTSSPRSGFALVPPDAKPNDCQDMCAPGP